jgi:hypothetical protein
MSGAQRLKAYASNSQSLVLHLATMTQWQDMTAT